MSDTLATVGATDDILGLEDEHRMFPLHTLLPKAIRRRIKALKKLQLMSIQLQANFYQEVHRLEVKYMGLATDLVSLRGQIVNGRYEPTDEECRLEEGYDSPEEDDPALQEVRQRLRERLTITRELSAGAQGIPEFWLTALRNCPMTRDMVCPHDEPALKHLTDVKVSGREEKPMSFTLGFHFSSNPYFSNKVLTKEYVLSCEVSEDDPWSFDGPEIVSCKGCAIDWLKGMDLTQKTVQKRQRHKTRSGQVRTVIKTVKNDSFFNFFSSAGSEELSLHMLTMQDLDIEVGSFLREKLVPRAVLYFTGEALDEVSSSDESESSGSTEGSAQQEISGDRT